MAQYSQTTSKGPFAALRKTGIAHHRSFAPALTVSTATEGKLKGTTSCSNAVQLSRKNNNNRKWVHTQAMALNLKWIMIQTQQLDNFLRGQGM